MGNIHPAYVDQQPQLTEREISYIILHTNFTRKQIDDSFVRFLSKYPRGSMSFDEFLDLYSNELKHLKNPRPLLERLFDRIDTDQSGRLNFKETLFFKAITMPETSQEEKLRWLFFLYDRNGDNRIDRVEFYDLFYLSYQIRGQTITQHRINEINKLFSQHDIDQNEQIDSNEFVELCRKSPNFLDLISPMFSSTRWDLDKFFETKPIFSSDELTDDRIEYLIKRTKFTREQILQYYQKFQSQSQSNRLSVTDFIRFYQKLIKSNYCETYCEYLFRAFDSLSPDGFIQFDEFLIAIYIHSNRSSAREKLEWLFQAYDRNGDGSISYEEVNQIVHALFTFYGIDREKHSASFVAYQIMENLDLNDDDQISKQEFLNLLRDKELTEFLAPTLVKKFQY